MNILNNENSALERNTRKKYSDNHKNVTDNDNVTINTFERSTSPRHKMDKNHTGRFNSRSNDRGQQNNGKRKLPRPLSHDYNKEINNRGEHNHPGQGQEIEIKNVTRKMWNSNMYMDRTSMRVGNGGFKEPNSTELGEAVGRAYELITDRHTREQKTKKLLLAMNERDNNSFIKLLRELKQNKNLTNEDLGNLVQQRQALQMDQARYKKNKFAFKNFVNSKDNKNIAYSYANSTGQAGGQMALKQYSDRRDGVGNSNMNPKTRQIINDQNNPFYKILVKTYNENEQN